MLVIELIAGLLFIGLVIGAALFITVVVPRQIKRLSFAHSLDGQIARKQEALAEQVRLLEELASEINTETDENRRLLLESHHYVVDRQRELLELDLRALKQQRDNERLDRSLERWRLR